MINYTTIKLIVRILRPLIQEIYHYDLHLINGHKYPDTLVVA